MSYVELFIERFDPDNDFAPRIEAYIVPKEEGSTVLEALLYIYEEIDSTLGFRFGCRFKSCGLCALEVNGTPRLACNTRLEDAMHLRPLSHLPRIRDLIIDREPTDRLLSQYNPYLVRQRLPDQAPEVFVQPESAKILETCRECLACLNTCPHYDYRKLSFGGPYAFVKLARFHYDPRDTIDRKAQIRSLGVEQCRECQKCRCVMAIPLYKLAIAPFIDE